MRCMELSQGSTLRRWKVALPFSIPPSPTSCTRHCKTSSVSQQTRSVTTMTCRMRRRSPTRATTATVHQKCSTLLWAHPLVKCLTLRARYQIRSQHQLNPYPPPHGLGHINHPTKIFQDQKHKCCPRTSRRSAAAMQIPLPPVPPRIYTGYTCLQTPPPWPVLTCSSSHPAA